MKLNPRKMQADLVNTLTEFNRYIRIGYLACKPQGDPNEHPQIKANNALLAKYEEPADFEIPSPFQIWPCQQVGQPGHYSVARPGSQPIFQAGAYHWTKDKAQAIADKLNSQK